MKKLLWFLIPLGLLTAGVVAAFNITVPQATQVGQVLIGNANGTYTPSATSTLGISGGSGTPGGSNTQVQFNDGGSFGASSTFIWNKASQFLGVGTSTPWATLTVQGKATSTTSTYLLDIASSTGSSYLMVTNQGKAGIGTTTPGNALTVIGDISDSNLTSGNCVQASTAGLLTTTGSACGSAGLSGGTNGKVAVWTSASTLSSGDLLDNLLVSGVNATSSTINFNVQGTGTLNPFNVASSSATSLFSVLANGNVGIGTSTPVSPFTFVTPAGNSGTTFPFLVNASSTLFTNSGTVVNSSDKALLNVFANGSSNNILFDVGSSNANNQFEVVDGQAINISRGFVGGGLNLGNTNISTTKITWTNTQFNNIDFSNMNINGTSGQNITLSPSNTLMLTASSTQGILIGSSPVANGTLSVKGIAGNYNIADFASSTGTSTFRITANGHLSTNGNSPALTSCGSSPSITGNDVAGTVTGGTGATACTVTFDKAYTNRPSCSIGNEGGIALTYTVTNAAITVTAATLGTGKFDYSCMGLAE